MRNRIFKKVLLLILLGLSTNVAIAQTITSVNPNSAFQGETELSVEIILSPDGIEMPPPDAPVSSVMIGEIEAKSSERNDTVVTAVFEIAPDEEPGLKDVEVTFVPPPDMGEPLIFSLKNGFTINELTETAPVITTQPKSQSVRIGNSITLFVKAYGSTPMQYQWNKDGVDIAGATESGYTIETFKESDAGSFICNVTNDFGSATSEEAILTVNQASYIGNYPIVDTDQTTFYNNFTVISTPSTGEDFYGQDAQYQGNQPSYTDNEDGTVTDNVTGLMWQQSFDHNNDGVVNYDDKMSYDEILSMVNEGVSFAGYDDWRLPTIKEQYSLIMFSGKDISGYEGTDTDAMTPFIKKDVFDYAYGDTDAGERLIDVQCVTTSDYVDNNDMVFGVNFADGRIKGYGKGLMGKPKAFNYLLVRGNTEYGINSFEDNGDGTITDKATGLMWMRDDNGKGLNWKEALSYAEGFEYAGYSDWRLPNAKELQSILDYTRSPGTTNSAAIDPLFNCTGITNEAGEADFPWYWSGTTHANWTEGHDGGWGAYVCFGRALGNMEGWQDVHGAGAQRSDPKDGDPAEYSEGHGPQGDGVRIYNYVRLVRNLSSSSGTDNFELNETGQDKCYDTDGNQIDPPNEGESLFGQDAQFGESLFSFRDNADGTITDNNTGLMWQQIPSDQDFSWQEAVDYCENLELAEYDDWRMPSAKELFSISDFESGWPYLDTEYFILASGQVSKDEQYWTSNYYIGRTVEGGYNSAFGVNHVTGHIKAYSANAQGPVGGKYVRAVRGNSYGENDFVDNGDNTVTDKATGLMWAKNDDEITLDWPGALLYAKNSELAGHSDWRLPNVKELQSIVDYSRSPSAEDTENIGPAIDPIFNCTPIVNEAGNDDYGYYWTSTSANFTRGEPYYYAWYVAFGMAVNGEGEDFHGAGGVRFDTKVEGGPLGEGGERYYNMVRLVRDMNGTTGLIENTNIRDRKNSMIENYPNPVMQSTNISFNLTESGLVKIIIMNSFGNTVATIINTQLSEGIYQYKWVPEEIIPGYYHYILTVSGKYLASGKMVLIH